jgi:hypothetical protein
MGSDMRLDRVEIKVNLSGDQAMSVVERLELPSADQPWQIYFCEDVARGVSAAIPLKEAGVILRARHRPDRKDDSTIKLRPGRRSQLTDYWLEAEEGEDWELKVEADWSGGRRVLAISNTADRPDNVVVDAGHGRRPRATAKSESTRLSWEFEGGYGPCGDLKVSKAVDHQRVARAREFIFPVRPAARGHRVRASPWEAGPSRVDRPGAGPVLGS